MLTGITPAAAGGSTDNQRHLYLPTGHKLPFGRLVTYLVHSHKEKISVHKFGHRTQTRHSHPYGGANDSTFGDGRIEQPLPAENVQQTIRHPESSPVFSNIFTKKEYAPVPGHFLY